MTPESVRGPAAAVLVWLGALALAVTLVAVTAPAWLWLIEEMPDV